MSGLRHVWIAFPEVRNLKIRETLGVRIIHQHIFHLGISSGFFTF